MVHLVLRELAPGVRLHVSPDARWKTSTIVARLAASLGEDPTRTALLPMVLGRGTERSPSARAITVRLESLYDADLETDVIRIGDAQVIEARLEVAGRAYTPRGAPDPLAEGLAFVAELLYRPALDPAGLLRAEVVRGEKENLRRHILGLRDDRADYAIERTARLLGRGEPSGRFEYGDVADLPAVGPEDLTARWRTLVERHPLDVIVAGDHDPDALEESVRRAFPFERRRPPPVAVTPGTGPPRPEAPVRKVERVDLRQAHLCMGYRSGVGYLDPDYAPFVLANAILGGDAQSRLFANVREEAGLAYDAASHLDRMKGTLIAHCGIDPANAALVESLVEAEVARLREEEVPGPELAEARKFAIEHLIEMEDDPQLRVAFSYGRALAGRTGVSHADLVERFRSVSAADVRRAARRLALDSVFLLTSKA